MNFGEGNANYLIHGAGAIAQRHVAIIREYDSAAIIHCVSASGRTLNSSELGVEFTYTCIENVNLSNIDIAIVASPAPFHSEIALRLLEKGVYTIVEKPFSTSVGEMERVYRSKAVDQSKLLVGYNLRFMKSAQFVHRLIHGQEDKTAFSVSVEVGQYLPDWRPNDNYKKGVSANKFLGGGAILELSHEIDYILWLFGPVKSVFCISNSVGNLNLDVETCVDAIFTLESGLNLTLHMDFLQRFAVRRCKIIFENQSVDWNLLKGRVTIQKVGNEPLAKDFGREDISNSYKKQWEHFLEMCEGDIQPINTLSNSRLVLKVVEAMKYSSAHRKEVNIEDSLK